MLFIREIKSIIKNKNCKPLCSTILSCVLLITISWSSAGMTLREGDIGPRVEELQYTLQVIGLNLDADGVYGESTKSAVKELQKETGAGVDGIYGEETRAHLSKKLVSDLDTKTYEISRGDTLSTLAAEENVSQEKIMILNDLKSTHLEVGVEIEIPVSREDSSLTLGRGGEKMFGDHTNIDMNSQKHTVRPDETLSDISAKYEIDIDSIRTVNNIGGYTIYPGQTLRIPGESRRNEPSPLERIDFKWPLQGRITSGFGARSEPFSGESDFHTGIDIAASHGTEVSASAAGVVDFAGWKQGYGYTVIIEHNDKITTLYAHNSDLLVRAGEEVSRGEAISFSGNTGVSTGPHLHFEIIKEGEPQNPVDYLP